MKTTQIGLNAENEVAKQMEKQGFEILSQNWRSPVCEIDIVAKKNKIIYFVEVKFRSSTSQGSGLDYITKKKLSQMKFAAQIWNQHNNWGGDWRLLAVSITTNNGNYLIEDIVEVG